MHLFLFSNPPNYKTPLSQGDIGGGKKSKYIDKSKLPFGDDLSDYVDKVGGGNIDIDSKVKWV